MPEETFEETLSRLAGRLWDTREELNEAANKWPPFFLIQASELCARAARRIERARDLSKSEELAKDEP